MASLNLTSTMRITGTWTDGDYVYTENRSPKLSLSQGSAAGQANFLWGTQLSVNPDASATIDLTSLPASALGMTGNGYLYSVKTLYVENKHQTGFITIGEATTNRWGGLTEGGIQINPGAFILVGDTGTGLLVGGSSKIIAVNNYASASVISLTGDTTIGSSSVSGLSSTSGLVVGMSVSGAGIPSGAQIAAIVSGTVIRLTQAATATDEGVAISVVNSPATVDVLIAGVLD